jgi:hypothetical protein
MLAISRIAAILGAAIAILHRRTVGEDSLVPKSPISPALSGTPTGSFPPNAQPLLLAVANVIAPRLDAHPGAGEIDLLPRLEQSIAAGSIGSEVFRTRWPSFEQAIRARVSFAANHAPDASALAEVLEGWYLEYRNEAEPSLAASYLEVLRRSVLAAYYSSPAGWASVGYPGPVKRPRPMDAGRHG